MKENVCMHGRQGQGKGTFRLVDVTTRPDHKTFDRPHCGFADCVQERARKWKCVSRLRSSMKNLSQDMDQYATRIHLYALFSGSIS